ncbi:mytimacin-2 [Plakobranchus ocellatus]|uniref:Mytimacin-2 n=1 Tax=Plakobranchus ocellatus TaxID=259542 RepID=A0AAV4BWA4_9GAST|nr:mytimacin-2 [Plakobranchus ocellatus]
MSQLLCLCAIHRQVSLIICVTKLHALVIRTAMVSRILRGHVMAPPFPLSNKATDVRPGCKTKRIAPTLRQVADLVCARTKERGYFKTCIVGHVNCCFQCGPTLTATSVLQVSRDKSRRLQCGPTLTVALCTVKLAKIFCSEPADLASSQTLWQKRQCTAFSKQGLSLQTIKSQSLARRTWSDQVLTLFVEILLDRCRRKCGRRGGNCRLAPSSCPLSSKAYQCQCY